MFKKCGSGTHIHSTTKVLLWCLSASPRTPTASLILLPPLLHCQNASLIGWEGGGETHLTGSQLVLFTHTCIGKKCKKKSTLQCYAVTFPPKKSRTGSPDWHREHVAFTVLLHTPTFILSLTHSVVLLPSLPQQWKPD